MYKFFFCFVITLFSISCRGERPEIVGKNHNVPADCGPSPNCVSSMASDSDHKIAPLPYIGSHNETRARLLKAIEEEPRARIIVSEDSYIHVEFASFVFRFVDDSEFFLDRDKKLLHFRSAARKGYSDMGVNRRRISNIVDRMTQSQSN